MVWSIFSGTDDAFSDFGDEGRPDTARSVFSDMVASRGCGRSSSASWGGSDAMVAVRRENTLSLTAESEVVTRQSIVI